jgi:hypothetical protein
MILRSSYTSRGIYRVAVCRSQESQPLRPDGHGPDQGDSLTSCCQCARGRSTVCGRPGPHSVYAASLPVRPPDPARRKEPETLSMPPRSSTGRRHREQSHHHRLSLTRKPWHLLPLPACMTSLPAVHRADQPAESERRIPSRIQKPAPYYPQNFAYVSAHHAGPASAQGSCSLCPHPPSLLPLPHSPLPLCLAPQVRLTVKNMQHA